METKKCRQIKNICFFSKNQKTRDKLNCSCKECDSEKELYKLFHFTNLQPMWAEDNMKKVSKIILNE
jgi:hypothetical protein